MQRKRSNSIYYSIMASFSIFVAGVLYFAYGLLPHQYYIPVSFAVLAVSGLFVYLILVRTVQL